MLSLSSPSASLALGPASTGSLADASFAGSAAPLTEPPAPSSNSVSSSLEGGTSSSDNSGTKNRDVHGRFKENPEKDKTRSEDQQGRDGICSKVSKWKASIIAHMKKIQGARQYKILSVFSG